MAVRTPPSQATIIQQRQQRLALAVIVGLLALAGVVIAATRSGGGSSVGIIRGHSTLGVLPFPGTPDASPESQITFTTLQPKQIKSLSVQGSRSGAHEGHMSALPDRRGTAFVPDRPFAPGETVTVEAKLHGRHAAAAAGVRHHSTHLSYQFVVARLPRSHAAVANEGPIPSKDVVKDAPTQVFQSRPDLRPPLLSILTPDANPDAGQVFIDAQQAPQNGPMILDPQGHLVFFKPLPGNEFATDVRPQTYRGQPVLTYWKGYLISAHGRGAGVILNQSYHRVATVHAAEGYYADLHEFRITSQNTALITAYQTVRADLSSIGGPKHGSVVDGIVQEIDIRTGRLLWEWHALGHIPVAESYLHKRRGAPYDFFHLNSVQQLPGGDLLISGRNTWAIYRVSRRTGNVIWQLGGKGSSFNMGSGTQFSWQHDAELHGDGQLTVFDNADAPKEESQSRAIALHLNTRSMTATLSRSFTQAPPVLAGSQGNIQILPNGNVFVGWGSEPDFSEYTPDGRQIFNVKFPRPVQSYRAYRAPWNGHPMDPPAISASPDLAGGMTVYASWNGATGVARWQLLAGSAPSKLTPVTEVGSDGFETPIDVRATARYVGVRAIGSSGQVLGTSRVISP
jgi:Arylsulfotransferase (ASST)